MTGLVVDLDPLAILAQSTRSESWDPARLAVLAETGGCRGVSISLREDRRSGQERDVRLLRELGTGLLEIRIPPSARAVELVPSLRPDRVVLVPERPEQLLPETGIDLSAGATTVVEAVRALAEAGIDTRVLTEPEREQVKAAHRLGLTGACLLGARLGACRDDASAAKEREKLVECLTLATKLGMSTQVAHGLDERALARLRGLSNLDEAVVGPALWARALTLGAAGAVADCRGLLR
ncbi:MAG: pyridoxine 5'-phosphate synthase [Acidobacteriota bacterium]